MEDTRFINCTATVDAATIDTSNQVIVRDFYVEQTSASQQGILVIQSSADVTIENFQMRGPHPDFVSASVISLSLSEGAEASLTDIDFQLNDFYGTAAIVVQGALDLFKL